MMIKRAAESDAALWRQAVSLIVPADERDHELISESEAKVALSDDRCYLLLALAQENTPIGLLNAYRFPDVEGGGQLVYLYDIEVLPEARRQGAGKALLEALTQVCESDGVKWIWAGTESSNTPARKAFEATQAELEGDSYVEYEWDLME